ncbi:hypothetical protein BU16DRAFT_496288 [Lophium mytilinum]|uniref:DUF4215 domain-containing protein n=1 Tax=Lophium mytilinum TaxID=390894 RepID=A0A6A6QBQ8_9PEZI|nr:hypothetical protein BU16DRAFT_496288 [Lophium mytilinum]
MRLSTLALAAGLSTAVIGDLLFHESLTFREYDEAVALGYTVKTVTDDEWKALTTADFAKYEAVVIADPSCGDVSQIKFFEDSKTVWSPAITGNIILIGTDPSFHFAHPGAKTLIDNSIKFVAAGKSTSNTTETGLYFALSCYYESVDSAKVDALSVLGDFTVRGNLACYNDAHLEAHSDAMNTLDDAALSDWSCSVHEAFSSYPSVGKFGFQALAIADGILGVGSQHFGDAHDGLPYIISRGATPSKCGDGIWDPELGEECDDGNTVNGDGCSLSCKCESGKALGNGHCAALNVTTSSSSTFIPSSTGTIPTPSESPVYSNSSSSIVQPSSAHSSGGYSHSSLASLSSSGGSSPTYKPSGYPISTPPVYTPPFSTPTYITPACPTGPKIIGVEIIIEVTITEICKTLNPTSTVTETSTVPCSTKERPIYDIETPGLPCYICAMKSASLSCPSGKFVTVSTTACSACSTYVPPVLYTEESCSGYTVTNTDVIVPSATYSYPLRDYPSEVPHSHQPKTTEYSIVSVGYPATTSLSTYIPTGAYTPTPSSSVVLFEGTAANVGVAVSALAGAAVLALAVVL